jgi:hypothetical protein
VDEATIAVVRAPTRWVDRGRHYEVVIDGACVGRLRSGEAAAFEVTPGKRQVFIKIDWVRSRTIEVRLSPGQRVELRCATPTLVRLPWALTLGRGKYIDLDIAAEADPVVGSASGGGGG